MIGTVALAERIEAAETRLSLAMLDVTRRQGEPSAFSVPVGTGAAVYCGPGSPMTKVIGAGIGAPITDDDIDRVEAGFASTGESPGWEVSTLGDFASVRRLEGRGYRLQRIELVLGCDIDALLPQVLPDGITVAQGRQDDWARIAVAGFAAAETVDGREAPAESYDTSVLERVVAQFGGVDEVRRYVAMLLGEPVGAASARVDNDIYQLCGAATLPTHRRQGVQSALLSARLEDARAAGCHLAVVTVEPGSRSQANVQRRGFVPLYSRLVLARS
ncbi:GNAT family N-acetyltransferase [Luteitalea sp.]|jgi:GNAT superfamily N-acetyltransferase|uniref:GNAT family N-acetyltransferase n=1 Tax=Luteitalea sp. TaxID=2004800 RepID=UPI0037C7FA13